MSAMHHFDVQLNPCKCSRPAIAIMDYVRDTPDKRRNGQPMVNRCCVNCYEHWFGPVGKVKQHTRKEWEKRMEITFDHEHI
jgi:hypothetical protein